MCVCVYVYVYVYVCVRVCVCVCLDYFYSLLNTMVCKTCEASYSQVPEM